MTPHPIEKITVESPVSLHNLTLFPVTRAASAELEYIASSVAIAAHGLVVTEVSDGGSVPNLLVENPSEHRVLLLDGEELRGAKQNRIINTTLLLAARSKTIIDVSCTESGRWNYNSATFQHSGSVMPTKARRKKTRSVSHTLQSVQQFHSHQGEVWDQVAELHDKIGSKSPTSAMADAYASVTQDMESAVGKFPCVENQCGMIVFIDNKPAGIDILSRIDVYGIMHAQLVQSYAMEALANKRSRVYGDSSTRQENQPSPPDVLTAKAFLERCAAIKGAAYRSVALGMDWRYVDGPIVGSGLEVDHTWVHMAYFHDEPEDGGSSLEHGRMVRMSRRSGYRRGDDRIY